MNKLNFKLFSTFSINSNNFEYIFGKRSIEAAIESKSRNVYLISNSVMKFLLQHHY